MRILLSTILSLTFLAVTGMSSYSAEKVGMVLAIEGKATAIDADNKTRSLELKSPIFMNDKLVTDEKSKIQVIFDDDTVISQGEKAEITIDEYVYDAKSNNKEDVNCSVNAAKGVFRVVTGKITKMNPDRFKVKTKMATIGIRGCEVGVKVKNKGADVYVIGLHGTEKVVVDVPATPQGVAQDVLIDKPGTMVTFDQDTGLQQRETTPNELTDLMVDVTPEGSDPTPETQGDAREQGFEQEKQDRQESKGTEAGSTEGNKNDGKDNQEDGNAGAGNDDKKSSDPAGTEQGNNKNDGKDTNPADGDAGIGNDGKNPDSGAVTEPAPGAGDAGGAPVAGGDTTVTPPVTDLPPPPPVDVTAPSTFDTGGDLNVMPVITMPEPPAIDFGPGPVVQVLPDEPPPQPIEEFVQAAGSTGTENEDGTVTINPEAIQAAMEETGTVSPEDPAAGSTVDPIGAVFSSVENPGVGLDPTSGDTYVVDPNSGTIIVDAPVPEPPAPTDPTLPTDPTPTEPPPPTDQNPPAPTSQFVSMGGGTDWSWGYWELSGVPQSVSFSGNAIAPVDFDAIVAGSTLYNLTGSGAAGAIVREGSYAALVQGTCNLGVQIGQNVSPTWNGSFSMANGGDSLNFSASGIFAAGNTLTGSPISYTMVVNGSTYDNGSITYSGFNGALTGAGTGKPTGIFGSFDFDHGGAASAQGGFGSDLN